MTSASAVTAIPTRYKGYHFRSRLEARWAVFFDHMQVEWEYEPEGFFVDGVPYLPDFRVVQGDLTFWYEIKPKSVTSDSKFEQFRAAVCFYTVDCDNDTSTYPSSEVEAFLLSGDPWHVYCEDSGRLKSGLCPRCGRTGIDVDSFNGSYGFLCYDCDMVTPCGGDNDPERGFGNTVYTPRKGWVMCENTAYLQLLTNVMRSCQAARSARFEHGHCGAS